MKITIESDDLTQEEMLRNAIAVYRGCKDGINTKKDFEVKVSKDGVGIITQQGKVTPYTSEIILGCFVYSLQGGVNDD